MTHKLDLPAGGVAEMKDAKEITRGEKRKVENAKTRAAISAVDNPMLAAVGSEITPETVAKMKAMSDEQLAPFEDYQNLMVTTCLVSWSHGKLPVDQADMDDMPDEDYEALVAESHEIIFRKPLDFGPDGAADPKALTDSSNGSPPT